MVFWEYHHLFVAVALSLVIYLNRIVYWTYFDSVNDLEQFDYGSLSFIVWYYFQLKHCTIIVLPASLYENICNGYDPVLNIIVFCHLLL